MTESSEETCGKRKDFFCGVVEGFYGRPWTTDQRKDLFQKLKKWGMDMYVYAPKDDYKHRAYWRELYTVEEAEHLTSLISAAQDQDITFCYALSPGLDITYSSQKEVTALKRKLEQVAQFGCTCFALLFDDIEPEMSEADKQIFQSFAHAQVSITNEIHQHLGCPRFLLCPTQYCSTRAVPTVVTSEYLNTLGTKLSQEINIMWTGPKVISKTLTKECIQEITETLRRPPVIWDNLHANDYDQKRLFLGPYCGRSPELIPLLRGVLTNPNCEYNGNLIPIRTLAHWAKCSLDAPTGLEAVSWDIKLEREDERGVCDDEPPSLSKHVYHPRQALRQAITEWLPEFLIPKAAQGPVIKPQPPVPVPAVPLMPILPSVNTCMSLTTTTTSMSQASPLPLPTVTASALLADRPRNDNPAEINLSPRERSRGHSLVPTNIINVNVLPAEPFTPVPIPIMNSLVSPTKVILNESIPNPIIPIARSNLSIPTEIQVSSLPVPILGIKPLEQENGAKIETDQTMVDKNDSLLEEPSFLEDLKKEKELEDVDPIIVDDLEPVKIDEGHLNGNMSVGNTPVMLSPREPSLAEMSMEALDVAAASSDIVMTDGCSDNGSMQVEPSNSPIGSDMLIEAIDIVDTSELIGEPPALDNVTTDDVLLLCELFYLPFCHGPRGLRLLNDYQWLATHDPRAADWRRTKARFTSWTRATRRLARRLDTVANRELAAEIRPYLWELCAVLALLHAHVRWLELCKLPANGLPSSPSNYTWFSKGWREAFESGAQEPWVFRGGLTADLRRLLPIECSGEFIRPDNIPPCLPLVVRPYRVDDEDKVSLICHKTCRDGGDCTELFPTDLQTLPADRLVLPFLTLTPEFCMVIEDDQDELIDREFDCEGNETGLDTKILDDKPPPPNLIGYACAALSCKDFYKRQEIAWVPEMCVKYPAHLADRDDLSPAAKECIRSFHSFPSSPLAPASVLASHPSLMSCCVLRPCRDPHAAARLCAALCAALRTHGSTGVHACINTTDIFIHEFYTKLGFVELFNDSVNNRVYMGRSL